MKEPPVLHPFLFVAFPILALYVHNKTEVLLSVVVWPLVVCLSATFVVWVVLSLLMRDAAKAGVIVSLLVVLLFAYVHIYNAIEDLMLGSFEIGRHRYLMPVLGVLGVVAIVYAARTKRRIAPFTSILNVAGGVLLLLTLGNGLWFEFTGRTSITDASRDDPEWTNRDVNAGVGYKPDIYYIVLDRYASEETLRRAYGYDNGPFIRYLEEAGFYVASKSRCNYAGTLASLASTLNLTYLDRVKEEAADSPDRTAVYPLLRNYKVQRYLRSVGYRYVHMGSWWPPTRTNPFADQNVRYGPRLSEFSMQLVRTTPPGLLLSYWRRDTIQRQRVLHKLNMMPEIIRQPGPKFVFLHLLLPHDPYLFGREGETVAPDERKQRSDRENYVNQLVFTDSEMRELVTRILAESKRPPIIILTSDEGPTVPRVGKRNRFTKEACAIRTGILNAYYFPGVEAAELHPSITPVNTFRVLFDSYFGTHYGLLEDRVYWSEDPVYPYRFVDVTDKTW
jgi:hypothetical protein